MIRKLYQWRGAALTALAALALAAAPAGAEPPAPIQMPAGSYVGWHLPLPAGEWVISRGPCGSAAYYDHECGYYENACAVDLIPLAGGMEAVPVLAPQAAQVFFIGRRDETGQMLMLRHADGRMSVFMHLSRIVVNLDDRVTSGQVVAYAGHTGTGKPHLHFYIQPNVVERTCASLAGLDTLDFLTGRAVSANWRWDQLQLVDPPAALPDWLPMLSVNAQSGVQAPGDMRLTPGLTITLPVAVAGAPAGDDALVVAGAQLTPAARAATYALYQVPVAAPAAAGQYTVTFEARRSGQQLRLPMALAVRPRTLPVVPEALLLNPGLVGPENWTYWGRPPELCWRIPPAVALPAATLRSRVVLAGPTAVASEWLSETCWRPPRLAPGLYYWKVFLKDPQGALNRPNQRPFAFYISR